MDIISRYLEQAREQNCPLNPSMIFRTCILLCLKLNEDGKYEDENIKNMLYTLLYLESYSDANV